MYPPDGQPTEETFKQILLEDKEYKYDQVTTQDTNVEEDHSQADDNNEDLSCSGEFSIDDLYTGIGSDD